MSNITFEATREEYARLWASMELRPSKAAVVEEWARKIIDYKAGRYGAVEKATGVPWFVVGILHLMEAGLGKNGEPRFDRHLHNGDPLSAKTWQVPKGRPPGDPPWTWAQSAADALMMHNLHKVSEWPLERIMFEVERYNGWGYRSYHPGTLSPYLWSFTNHYARGKYVADGKWDPNAVSGQCGAMALLKKCAELDPDVRAALDRHSVDQAQPAEAAVTMEEKVADPSLSFPKAEPAPVPIAKTAYQSKSIWALVIAGIQLAIANFTTWLHSGWDFVVWSLGVLPEIADEVKTAVGSSKELFQLIGIDCQTISISIALGILAVVAIRHLNDKRKLPA